MAWQTDGASSYMRIADNAAFNLNANIGWTIAGWLQIPGGGDAGYPIGWNAYSTSNSWAISVASDDDISFRAYKVAWPVDYSRISDFLKPATASTWYHIAVVCPVGGGKLDAYVNGSWTKQGDQGLLTTTIDYAGDMAVGCKWTGSASSYIATTVAEWAKWDRALSTDEILALGKGYVPSHFMNGLGWYLPMTTIDTTELIHGLGITNVNGVTTATHPPSLIYPSHIYVGHEPIEPVFTPVSATQTAKLSWLAGLSMTQAPNLSWSAGLSLTEVPNISWLAGLSLTEVPNISWPAGLSLTEVPNISWPAGLSLTEVPNISWPAGLSLTEVPNISWLAGLSLTEVPNISWLAELSSTEVLNISWLAELSSTEVSNISWLAGLSLTEVPNISWLAGLSLTETPNISWLTGFFTTRTSNLSWLASLSISQIPNVSWVATSIVFTSDIIFNIDWLTGIATTRSLNTAWILALNNTVGVNLSWLQQLGYDIVVNIAGYVVLTDPLTGGTWTLDTRGTLWTLSTANISWTLSTRTYNWTLASRGVNWTLPIRGATWTLTR